MANRTKEDELDNLSKSRNEIREYGRGSGCVLTPNG